MVRSVNSYAYLKKQKTYEREISIILHKIILQENLPSCSVSYSLLSKKGESLKVYLNFSYPEQGKEGLEMLNKKYTWLIKKELARQKKFAYLPRITFFGDEKLAQINELEKIINKK